MIGIDLFGGFHDIKTKKTCLTLGALTMGLLSTPLWSSKAVADHHGRQTMAQVPSQGHQHRHEDDHNHHHSHERAIQVALLLDTSGSMEGLINQAREHLWSVVNSFAECKTNGERPRLEVALYEYGNDRLSSRSGFIRQVCPFTSDLDQLSESLFSLSTNGGSEHCGQVIDRSLSQLPWSVHQGSFRAIFIAGNEPFTQGPTLWNVSCRKAVDKGVVVNTIFCGNRREGIDTSWKDGALLAKGEYLHIDHNKVSVYQKAPQDDRISQLNAELNDTYVSYGAQCATRMRRQKQQDQDAQKLSMTSFFSRAKAKASRMYNNSSWDLVDAMEEGDVELNEEVVSSLSPELKVMEKDELQAHLESKKERRASLQLEISELQKQREIWAAENKKAQVEKGENRGDDLGEAMIKALQKQTAEKGITLP